MDLVLPQDGGIESPSNERAPAHRLSSLIWLLAMRAAKSFGVLMGARHGGENPSRCDEAKVLATHDLPLADRMAKVCGLGNLGVDFRSSRNFNRLE